MQNANDHLCELPTIRKETKGHLKFLFKGLQSLCFFYTTHPLLQKAHRHLAKPFPRHSTPHGHQEEEETSASLPYQLWRTSEGAIQTCQHLTRLGQAPPLLGIHLRPLRPRPYHLLRVRCPLALLSAYTWHEDRQLFHLQSHQYTTIHQIKPIPQALERHLVRLQPMSHPRPLTRQPQSHHLHHRTPFLDHFFILYLLSILVDIITCVDILYSGIGCITWSFHCTFS